MNSKKFQNPSPNNFLLPAAIGLLSVVILVIGLMFITKNSNSNSTTTQAQQLSSGKLNVAKNNFELGDVSMAKGNVDLIYELTNNSNDPVTINKIDTSCMCTKAQLMENDKAVSGWAGMAGMGPGSLGPLKVKKTIAPGETIKIRAEFDPNAHGPDAVGPIRRTVSLYTNSEAQPTIALNFSGNVTK